MTSTVTTATTTIIVRHTFEALSTTVGVVAIILLVWLLAQEECMRTFGGRRSRAGVPTFAVAIAPLLCVFLWIVSVRFLHLLHGTLV